METPTPSRIIRCLDDTSSPLISSIFDKSPLEVETERDIEVTRLLRRLSPDFETIADFRRVDRTAFRRVFWEFVALCRELEVFGHQPLTGAGRGA